LLLVAGTLRWQADPALGGVQHLPSLFAAVWFISRLLTFDTDYRFWPWLAGISKLRNPAQVFATLGRLREPRPLKALSATVDLSRLGSASAHITITNRSRWPVGHLKLQRMALAGLLAPQSLAAVRAGQLDRKAFNLRSGLFPSSRPMCLLNCHGNSRCCCVFLASPPASGDLDSTAT
jgi:hypothetical protein